MKYIVIPEMWFANGNNINNSDCGKKRKTNTECDLPW